MNVDYSEESHFDLLIRNTTIQLCLSIQQSLGFRGDFNPRTFSGKFSWIVLQLRNIVVVVTMAANMKVKGPNNEPSSPLEDPGPSPLSLQGSTNLSPEVINALAGSVRWVLDLMAWITDTLLTLPSTLPSSMDLAGPTTLSLPDLLTHLRATNNISLHLLLSSPTRGFLTAICRRLAHIDYIARKAIMHNNPNANHTPTTQSAAPPSTPILPTLRAAYMQIATLTSSAILRLKTFETLLISVSASIKTAYASATPSLGTQGARDARNMIEIKMMLGGALPDAFRSVVVELFRPDGLLDSVREEIDPAKLFFADFALLEVDEDAVSVGRRRGRGETMDCFRKGWLADPKGSEKGLEAGGGSNGPEGVGRQGARWRRCARCAAVMEDVLSQRQALQWLVMQQRRCFCSGYWDTLNPGEVMA